LNAAPLSADLIWQYLLGLMYDKGHGVPRSDVLAYKWLNLAAAHAQPGIRELLFENQGRGRCQTDRCASCRSAMACNEFHTESTTLEVAGRCVRLVKHSGDKKKW